MTLEEIYNFIGYSMQDIPTVYEDEGGMHYGEIRTLDEGDMLTVFSAIEDLLNKRDASLS